MAAFVNVAGLEPRQVDSNCIRICHCYDFGWSLIFKLPRMEYRQSRNQNLEIA